ncbi:hypothetical protein CHARACLAT_022367 [Characodon lateralis]|uniref:Uncharacterized protein n=1 Tax=Characodon lateralis TaxID=208331 RepID=A0ABU7DTA4_9TELE|nr:hypothetical protein [Characodon lateralis]
MRFSFQDSKTSSDQLPCAFSGKVLMTPSTCFMVGVVFMVMCIAFCRLDKKMNILPYILYPTHGLWHIANRTYISPCHSSIKGRSVECTIKSCPGLLNVIPDLCGCVP